MFGFDGLVPMIRPAISYVPFMGSRCVKGLLFLEVFRVFLRDSSVIFDFRTLAY